MLLGHFSTHRRGQIVPLVAIALPLILIPILAFTLDGGMLLDDKRRAQAAVDAAALAGAVQLSQYPKGDATGKAAAQLRATAVLGAHGFTTGNCSTLTVNTPATSADPRINGQEGTIEVIITYMQPRFFSSWWGGQTLAVKARAVASVKDYVRGNGFLLLDPHGSQALYAHGNPSLIVNNGGIVVDSDNATAAQTSGGPVIAAQTIDVTGGTSGSAYFLSPYNPSAPQVLTPTTGSVPVPDPLAGLVQPTVTPIISDDFKHPPVTLSPGHYTGSLDFSGSGTVTLQPGIYLFDNGFKVAGGVSVTGTGVTLINTDPGTAAKPTIDLSGGGSVTLSPPTSGPTAGITIWQNNPASTAGTTSVRLTGGAGTSITGTLYMPNAKLDLRGSSSVSIQLANQVIAYDAEVQGNVTFTIDYNGPRAPQPKEIDLVE